MDDMKNMLIDEFQYTVQDLLVRNKSILDSLTKLGDSTSRISRSIVKAVTQCGCIQINASKQELPDDTSFEELKGKMKTHVEGALCDNCRDIIEKELGKNLFYFASICNTLDINLYDVLIKELERVRMLGNFNLR